MKNLTASYMTVAICSAIVFFHCNSYAFPEKTLYSKTNTYERYNNSIYANDTSNEQDEDYLSSDEEMFHNTQKNSHTSGYLRATIETSTLLGLVSLYYWGTRSSSGDFDYNVSFETLKNKFTGEAILFDDNSIGTNSFPGHPISGSYYYLIARNHKLSRAESFLWSFAASAVHEFFVELPEVASINDFIVTPVAGASIGEAMYEFGRYFRCSENKDSFIYKAMAAIMDPIALLNSFIWDDVHYKYSDNEICHYNSIQKYFSIFYGMSADYHDNIDNSNIGFIFGFHGKLYFIPQYGKAADIEKFFKDTILTEMGIEVGVTDIGVSKIYFLAKTVWAAYYRQNIVGDSVGKGTGYSFFVGFASAFEHIQYDTGEFEDWIGAVHVLGPSMEFVSFHNAGYIRIGLDVFGDFAMVRPFAFDKYKKSHSLDNIKSSLREEDYYYAYGAYINPKIEVNYRPYRFLAEYKYAYYDSFEDRDRRKPSNDFDLVDKREEYGFVMGRHIDFFAASFFKTHQMWLEAEVRRIERSGFIADDNVSHNGGNTWLLLRFKMML